MNDDKGAPLLAHLEELRRRIFLCGVAILITSILIFLFPSIIFDHILFAPLQPDFITYKILCKFKSVFGDVFCHGKAYQLLALDLEAQLSAHIMGAITGGIILSLPFILYQVWAFVSPALYPHEKKAIITLLISSIPLFMTGLLFSYFVMLPFTIRFLIEYKISDMVVTTPTLSSYIKISLFLLFFTAITFELPLIIYILVRSGFISRDTLKQGRKIAFIIVLIVAAIITPTTDGFTMLILALPLYALYELSIWITIPAEKKSSYRGVGEEGGEATPSLPSTIKGE